MGNRYVRKMILYLQSAKGHAVKGRKLSVIGVVFFTDRRKKRKKKKNRLAAVESESKTRNRDNEEKGKRRKSARPQCGFGRLTRERGKVYEEIRIGH